jgi:type II secretion system protein N
LIAHAMSKSTSPSQSDPRRRWLRWILLAVLLLVILVILLVFFVTSGAFLRGVLLPRIGQSYNAEITATDGTLHRFSGLSLQGLRVQTIGTDPVFAADELHLRYRLRNLLAGRVELDELTLVNPALHVIEQPDGTSNIDPLLEDRTPAESRTVDLRNLSVRNGTVRWSRLDTDGPRTEIGITRIEARLDRLANDAAGRLTLTGDLEAGVTQADQLDRLAGGFAASVAFDLDADLQPRSLTLTGTNDIASAEGAWRELANSKTLVDVQLFPDRLEQATARFLRADQTLGQIHASGPLDLPRSEATLTLAVDEIGHPLLNLVGAPWGVQFGDMRLDAIVELALLEGGTSLATSGRINADPGGSIHLDGSMDLEQHHGEFTLSLLNLNEFALGPILDPLLAPHHLHSMALNGTSSLAFDSDDRGRLRAELQVTNLITGSASQPYSISPLRAGLQLDTSWDDDLHSLHAVHLTLAPTARADNELHLTGFIDLSEVDPTPSELQLTSASLDLTPLYNLFFPPTTTDTPPASPDSAPTDEQAEPEAMDLAWDNLKLQTRIDHLFLRETHLSNVVATTTLHGNTVRVDPLSASMQGAPLSGLLVLDLGLTGWRYELQLDAANLPLEPLVNSFVPEYSGQYRGLLQANLTLQGQGITPASLQQHLQGRVDVTFTNAEIQLVSPTLQQILVPIAGLLRLPQLTESPLDWVRLQSRIGDGDIQLDELVLQSAAFQARTSGSVAIQPDLQLASLNLPLRFQLRRSLADRARLVPRNTPPDAAYVPLPDFATVRGTLGNLTTELDPGAITGLLLQSGIGIAEEQGIKIEEPAGRLLRGIGDILGGAPLPGRSRQPEPEPESETNRPPTTPVPAP